MNNHKPILLVESSDNDAKAIELALHDVHVTNSLERKTNPQDVLTYLKEDHHPKPCMILLDTNLPQMEALELFNTIKTDATLKDIPVVLLMSAEADEQIAEQFGPQVAGVIQKPFDYQQFIETMRQLGIHWILSGTEQQV